MSLKNKFDRNKELLNNYNNFFKDYESEGVIEKVAEIPSPGKAFYLPHRAVLKQDRSTTKAQVVFNGSAKAKDNTSLNDCLYSDPCLLPLIFGILLKFRTGVAGLAEDVKQTFLNIEIDERDRDYLKFLWFDHVFSADQKSVSYRVLRVISGITSSPFLLPGTIKAHLWMFIVANIDVGFILNFFKNLYIDDVTNHFDC